MSVIANQDNVSGRQFARLVCVGLIFVFSIIANAEHLPIKTYTVADGLLRDTVSKIKQDSRGFLWFCTAEGISRFDGYAFTKFTVADGLPNRFVEDFIETKSGVIYLATDNGLARLNPNGISSSTENPLFTAFLPDNPKAAKILTLYEDKDNQVWVGTADGLYKLTEAEGQIAFELVPLGEPLGGADADSNAIFINTILKDRQGTLWIGTMGSGLFRLSRDGKMRRLTMSDGLGDNMITDLLEDRENRLWASMSVGQISGLCLLDEQESEHPVKKCYSTKDGLPSNWIRGMLKTSDGKFWLATVSGLCEWQGEGSASVCKTYTAKNGLCLNAESLSEDKDGNLWVGSSCGAHKIARYGFTTYDDKDGLGSPNVNSIFENSAGDLFVSINANGRDISRFDGEHFSFIKSPLPRGYSGWGWQQTVLHDSKGAWWIPTGSGVVRSPDDTSFENLAHATLETVKTGAKVGEIFRLFEDSHNDIWISVTGTANELLRWERTRNIWHNYTPQVGFSKYRIGSAFAEDHSGNVWIGASSDQGDSAVIRYRNGEFLIMTEAEGVPSGWIRDLFLDSRGRLWIASTNSGVWRIDDLNADNFEFIKYTPANGLTSISNASVAEDEFGRIYIGSWHGIDRLNPDTGQVENFTIADGLPASFVESSYRDRHNNLWFATHEGIARYVPEPPRTREPPNVLITALRVNGDPQSVSVLGESAIPSLDLNSDQKQISVDFLGLGASLGEKLKYEYRLGVGGWTPTNERTLNFANLNSGEYRFEARAVTADRIYSQAATVEFRIAAPVWKRWWFIALILILSALAAYLFYKNRLERLLEIERMRTLIATDLHDDIGANLTRISLLSEVAKRDNGNENLLTSIADIARESVASMNDIVWAIAPEHDSLLDLTRRMRQHAEEIFALRDIDLEFYVPTTDTELKLNVGVRRDVLLIFKEAVNNAARHSDCTKVAIDFRVDKSILFLRINDNGKGFTADPENDGQGLRSMTRRAKALGGNLTIESKAENGTLVKFELVLVKDSRV